jgi:hypothetical protein
MHICVSHILKCRELKKNKKTEITVHLCRVYAHGKGPFGHFAVCTHTAKGHVAHTCVPLALCLCAGRVFAVRFCGRRTAKAQLGARQHPRTAQIRRTAEILPTAERMAHGNEGSMAERCRRTATRAAQQREASPPQRILGTAKSLPCSFCPTHGKESFTEPNVAVRSLPCIDAQQSHCRVFWSLCRADMPHGNVPISGSVFP